MTHVTIRIAIVIGEGTHGVAIIRRILHSNLNVDENHIITTGSYNPTVKVAVVQSYIFG